MADSHKDGRPQYASLARAREQVAGWNLEARKSDQADQMLPLARVYCEIEPLTEASSGLVMVADGRRLCASGFDSKATQWDTNTEICQESE